MDRSLFLGDPDRLAAALAKAGLASDAAKAGRSTGWRPLVGGAQKRWSLDRPETERRAQKVRLAPTSETQPAPLPATEDGSDYVPPPGNLQDRLEHLFDWIQEQVNCTQLFVVDREGLVIHQRDGDPVLIAVSSAFMNLLERINDTLETQARSSVAIDLDDELALQLVRVETGFGDVALGVVAREQIQRALVRKFQKGLDEAMDEDEAT